MHDITFLLHFAPFLPFCQVSANLSVDLTFCQLLWLAYGTGYFCIYKVYAYMNIKEFYKLIKNIYLHFFCVKCCKLLKSYYICNVVLLKFIFNLMQHGGGARTDGPGKYGKQD